MGKENKRNYDNRKFEETFCISVATRTELNMHLYHVYLGSSKFELRCFDNPFCVPRQCRPLFVCNHWLNIARKSKEIPQLPAETKK